MSAEQSGSNNSESNNSESNSKPGFFCVNPAVSEVLNEIMNPPPGATFFANNFLDGGMLREMVMKSTSESAVREPCCKVTGLTPREDIARYYNDGKWFDLTPDNALESYRPTEAFQYAFSFPYLDEQARPYSIEDRFTWFECSKGSESQDRAGRYAMSHIMSVESLFHAVIPGGFFGSLLPKNWMKGRMKYLKWWNDNVNLVAKIRMPSDAVHLLTDTGKKIPVSEEFTLYIWTKPFKNNERFKYSRFSWPQFSYNFKHPFNSDKSHKEIKSLGDRFGNSEWYYRNVLFWRKALLSAASLKREYSLSEDRPVPLPKPEATIFVKPSKKAMATFRVVKDRADIAKMPFGLHIQPGPPIKLIGYSVPAQQRLLQYLTRYGYKNLNEGKRNTDPRMAPSYLDEIRNMQFSDFIEKEIKNLLDAGFIPCVLERDIHRIKKHARWLDLQLAPIERAIEVRNEDGRVESWDRAYEDSGVRSLYSDVIEMYRKRMERMGLKKLARPYQFEDLAVAQVKSGVVNGQVVGLGKTLFSLWLQAVLTNKRMLLVVPSGLVNEWQEEIENMFTSWAMRNRNWRGERIPFDYQIIEWASECKFHKLRTINIISYEKLSSVPRDAQFYVCPKCDFIVCSNALGTDKKGNPLVGLEAEGKMPCPKCNHGVRQQVKAHNRAHGLKKRTIVEVHPVTGEKRKSVVDDRMQPTYVFMNAVDDRFKKRSPGKKKGVKDIHLRWTFANILRNYFTLTQIDEALLIMNAASQRSRAMGHVTSRRKLAITGTPMKGDPTSALALLNYVTKRTVYPDYRLREDRKAKQRFLDKYGTYVTMTDPVTNKETSKLLPKITNPEGFQTDIAPVFIRRIRTEPEVASCIKPATFHMQRQQIEMDKQHRQYYEAWLDMFCEWVEDQEEKKKRGDGVAMKGHEVLVKLGYLQNASTCPHHIDPERMKPGDGKDWAEKIGKYKGPITAKQKAAFQLVAKNNIEGDKSIVFSGRRSVLTLGQQWCTKYNIPALVAHGGISNKRLVSTNRSKRHEIIQKFRHDEYSVLFAGLQALGQGLNIPEANHVIFTDMPWEPTWFKQGIGRVDRPQQKKEIYVTMLLNHGTIDDYKAALCILKSRSADEAIDHSEFKEFGRDMILDPIQYAKAIVDGTEEVKSRQMWLEIEAVFSKKQAEGESLFEG